MAGGLSGCVIGVPSVPGPGAVCDAAGAAFAIGAAATPILIEQARIGASASTVRVIWPGDLVTLDYHTDRLNIELDAVGQAVAVTCN